MVDNRNNKSKSKKLFCFTLVILMIVLLQPKFVKAQESEPELIKGYVTAYNGPSDTTCMGTKCREGICGGCEAYLGKVIILYKRLPGDEIGDLIGIYECQDTGTGTKSFQEGKLIDVWQPKDELQDFINMTWEDGCNGKVFIQVIDGKG